MPHQIVHDNWAVLITMRDNSVNAFRVKISGYLCRLGCRILYIIRGLCRATHLFTLNTEYTRKHDVSGLRREPEHDHREPYRPVQRHWGPHQHGPLVCLQEEYVSRCAARLAYLYQLYYWTCRLRGLEGWKTCFFSSQYFSLDFSQLFRRYWEIEAPPHDFSPIWQIEQHHLTNPTAHLLQNIKLFAN